MRTRFLARWNACSGDPGLHAQLAAGCREAVARLGWEEPACAMESLYGQLVEAESRVA